MVLHANRNGKVCYLHRRSSCSSRLVEVRDGTCGWRGRWRLVREKRRLPPSPTGRACNGYGRWWSRRRTREKRIPAGKPSRQRRVPRDLTVPVEFPIALQWEFILTDVPAAAAARAQLADGHPKVIMISNRFFIFITYIPRAQ